MIPLSDISKPQNYAYVAGCRNVAWLVGKVVSIEGTPEQGHVLWLSRQNREGEELAFPVHMERGDRVPEGVTTGKLAKVICHLYSGRTSEEDEDLQAGRYLRLIAKSIGHPTILDVNTTEEHVSANVSTESAAIPTLELGRNTLTAASNQAEVAGFVDGSPTMVRDSDNQRQRLVFMLRQAASPQHCIAVEMSGKQALAYRKKIRVGLAVMATGMILTAKRADTGRLVPVFRSNSVRLAEPEQDLKFSQLPDWACDIRKRYEAHVAQERQRLAALEAAREVQIAAGADLEDDVALADED